MKKSMMILMCSALFVISGQSFADTYYKWVGKDGSTHYTLTPPPKGAKALGKMETYRDYSPSYTSNPTPTNTTPSQTTPSTSTTDGNPTPEIPMPEPVAEPQIQYQPGKEYIPLPR